MKKVLSFAVYSFVFVSFFSFQIFAQNHNPTVSAQTTETPLLGFGQTFEKEISNGEKHFYKLNLKQNQFVKIEVLQTDCDVMLALLSPEKINVFEFKNENEANGAEFQTAAVETDGEYELRVMTFGESEKTGKYALRIAEMREATDKELSQTSAFKIINGLAKNVKAGTATAEQITKVISDFETALEKFRFAGNRKYEAMTLSSIGSFYTRLGNWNKAVEIQKKSIEIVHKIEMEEEASMILTNLGTSYLRQNEPQKALEVFHESIRISEKRVDIFNEIRTLNLLGTTYEEIGDTARAIEFQTQALEKSQTEQEDNFLTQIFNDLGRLNANLGENRKAIEYFQKAVESAQKSNNKRLEASTLGNLGQTFFALGDKQKAFEFLNKSLEINHSLADKFGEAATLKKLGNIYLKLGENDKAIENLNKSLEIYRLLEDTQNLAETLLLSAKIDSQKNSLETAQTKIEEAISLIEKIRLRVNVADLRDSFSANLQDFYASYIEILMKRHKLEPNKNFAALALQSNERARARGLLNLLAESNANIRQGVDEKLLAKESEIQNLLTARLENLTKVLNGKAKPEEIENLKQEIAKIRTDFEQIQAQIRAANPHYSSLTQPKMLDVKEIQAQILDENSVLLEYALGEKQSYLWIVGKTDFHAVELPAKFEIEQSAREFYEALTARNKQIKFETDEENELRIKQKDAEIQTLSNELSAKMLAPAMPFLNGKKLLVVADGALQYVPFAALKSKKDSFLIETNEIVNLPSASVLAVLRNEFAKRPLAPKTLAVLADPIFDKTDERFLEISGNKSKKEPKVDFVAVSRKRTRGSLETREGFELQRLPFTRREAEMIGAFVPENKREKLLDFAASRQSAMSPELANYRFVHFATHGILSNENPELSGIAFSMIDEKGKDQDGFLRVGDIYNLKFPAEMVVLSGCKTGLGREIKGEGLVGMTRGFMYAGAKRVTVSLWDVNDEATSELMGRFYKEMLGANKLAPASALRQAQISMLKDKRWQNPYFWSTFVLQGEPK